MIYGILIGIIVLLLAVIFCFFGIINSMTKQLREHNAGRTEKPVNIQIAFRPLNRLCNEINQAIQISKEREIATKRSSKSLKDSISNLSHDLRTPLTAILGYLTLLRKNPEKMEYIDIIEAKSKYLHALVDDFYDLSLIEEEGYTLQPEKLDVVAMLTDSLAGFYSVLTDANLTLDVQLPEHPIWANLDRVSFERILSNLIYNAVKYAVGSVAVSITEEDGKCIISVSNPVDKQNEIDINEVFNRFATGDRSRSNQSTGLGLYIVKTLAEKNGMRVEAKKEEDIFSILLYIKG